MSYTEIGDKVDKISYRLDSVKAIIELVAESTKDETNSSALWGAAELLRVYAEKLDGISSKCYGSLD